MLLQLTTSIKITGEWFTIHYCTFFNEEIRSEGSGLSFTFGTRGNSLLVPRFA